ncbi:DNA polymerase III subunit gamma/tau [Vibrio albus]|uniref:DNA polymerase III subunit gamma/tau n=1 Tax=Vibrio albus TaxID=2200953 RepID=A0A2U3BE54_9VIBR|nr:DNA polymerase III subunit gamma/tau [Vibrio albus]PWI35060.1 DNA polymerase III subunit gamma/tau [Vibrio albus]
MSYLALARKWRPVQFNQVVGQAHVLTALENALKQNKLHHAYLFSGTRGVGKTSIGRLFAKGLNCETGITATPCGQCETCREIDEGRFVDLLEIDAASRTKVEDIRELLDNVQYKPARGRFKVYLIDEVHMLSRHSFNALLKTLEEPPEHVKFLLATTDPQKLPVTILSRCLQFHLKPISVDAIHEQLDFILKQESVTSESRALGMIAHAADGSMRDALSLTDQAIALSNGAIDTATVTTMLGTLDADQAIHLLEAISSKQTETAMAAIQHLAQNGVEWDGLLQELASQLHRIAMYQALPATLDKDKPDAEKIELLSQSLTPQDVQLFYQIALKGRQDLPLAPTERMGLEMVVLRMIAFRPQSAVSANAIVLPTKQQAVVPEPPHRHQNTASSLQQPISQRTESSQPAPAQPMPQSELVVAGRSGEETNQPVNLKSPVIEPERNEPEQQPDSVSPPHEEKSVSMTGLRHQLRSRRNTSQQSADNHGKKSEAASPGPSSVLERVAQHGRYGDRPQTNTVSTAGSNTVAGSVEPQNIQPAEPMPEDSEPYQWQPSSTPVEEPVQAEVKPSDLKKALEHTKTPEMNQKLVEESIAQDEWSALIQRLNIPKLVEQLALNSAYQKNGSAIALELRPSHAHLNKDRSLEELRLALCHVLEEECSLTIHIGESGQTPLELREHLYQGKLASAFVSLEQDPNVQFIQKRFAAELDRDSVRPI